MKKLNKTILTGASAAAWGYFEKPAADLSNAEAAFLAGLPQAPSRLNPYRNLEGAKKRQEWILDEMERVAMISEQSHALHGLRGKAGEQAQGDGRQGLGHGEVEADARGGQDKHFRVHDRRRNPEGHDRGQRHAGGEQRGYERDHAA